MKPRHERKHEISFSDLLVLRQRFRAIAAPDTNGTDGRYLIRSLYFDTPSDRALREKLDGVDRREKFRIRCYDHDHSFIRLEKKCKQNSLGTKENAQLTPRETAAILQGDLGWMEGDDRPLVREFREKMHTQLLRPKTIVDYTREAFVYPAGNVRLTLDYDIRTGLSSTDFLDPACPTIPAGNAPIILEVKWDEFLPDPIRRAVQLDGRHTSAFSKYAACRIYG